MRRASPTVKHALALSLVLLLLAASAWFAALQRSRIEPPDAAPHASGGSRGASAPLESASVDPREGRVAVPESARDASAATGPAADWRVQGRLRLPAGTPAGETLELFACEPLRAREQALALDALHQFAGDVPGDWKGLVLELRAPHLYLELVPHFAHGEPAQGLELRPLLGARLRGRVRAASGLERASADWHGERVELELWPRAGHGLADTHRECVLADDLGFDFPGLPAEVTARVRIRPAGCLGSLSEVVELGRGATRELELLVRRGVRIRGRILDEDGSPRGYADILRTIHSEESYAPDGVRCDRSGDGSFELSGLPAGSIELVVSSEQRAPLSWSSGPLADGAIADAGTLILRRGLAIDGRVRHADGRAIPGAEIEVEEFVDAARADPLAAQPEAPMPPMPRRLPRRACRSDAQGAFALEGLAPGNLRLHVSAPWSASGGREFDLSREPVAAGTHGLEIVVDAGEQAAGIVVDERGEALTRFTLRASRAETIPGGTTRFGDVVREFAPEDGRFALAGLDAGTWTVVCAAPEHRTRELRELVLPHAGELRLVLERCAGLEAIVVDERGEPVSGARIERVAQEFLDTQPRTDEGSDEQGRIRLRSLPPGRNRLRAAHEERGWSDALELVLRPGETPAPVRLCLHAPGAIEGRVIGRDGRPAADCELALIGLDPLQDARGFQREALPRTDAEGRFRVERLAAGAYQLRLLPEPGASPPPSSSYRRDWVNVSVASGATSRVELDLGSRASSALAGRVLSRGRGQAGAQLTCTLADGSASASALSDDEGRFRLELEGAGAAELSLWMPDGTRAEERLELAAGRELAHDVDLPGARLHGRVLGVDARPSRAQVRACRRDDARGGESIASCDEQGAFAFDTLAPGEYDIEAADAGGCARLTGVRAAISEASPALELRLDPGASLSGSVRASWGAAARFAEVWVLDAAGRVIGEARAEPAAGGDCRFELRTIPPGRVWIRAADDNESSTPLLIELRSGAHAKLDIDLVPSTHLVVEPAASVALEGRVELVDARGLPCAQAWAGSAWRGTALEFGPLPPGAYVLRSTAADGSSQRREFSLDGEPVRTLTLGER